MGEKISLEQLQIKSFTTSIESRDQHIKNGNINTADPFPSAYSYCCTCDCPSGGQPLCECSTQ